MKVCDVNSIPVVLNRFLARGPSFWKKSDGPLRYADTLHNLLYSGGYSFQDVLWKIYGTLCGPLGIPGGPRWESLDEMGILTLKNLHTFEI